MRFAYLKGMNDNKMTRQEMIAELTSIQNELRFENQDILTITGFMSDEQVLKHLKDSKAIAKRSTNHE